MELSGQQLLAAPGDRFWSLMDPEALRAVIPEVMGTIDSLHPLQDALRKHHALQCGLRFRGTWSTKYAQWVADGRPPLE